MGRSSRKSVLASAGGGLPIPERAGVLRYFIRIAERIVWADQPEELMHDLLRGQHLPPGIEPPQPISVTFIPATVFENPALLRVRRTCWSRRPKAR